MKRLSLLSLAFGVLALAGCSSAPQPPVRTVADPVPVAGAPAAPGAPGMPPPGAPIAPGGGPITINPGAPSTPAAMGPNGMPPGAPPIPAPR